MYVYVYAYVCIYICIYICVCVYVCKCICMCMCVYVYIYVERQQERGVLKHVRKTRNHELIFRLVSRLLYIGINYHKSDTCDRSSHDALV